MPDTLEIRAFGHVVVPIAVVIAMGVARIVSSVGDYIRNRDRVRFALGHGLWSAILFLVLVGLWWTVWGLRRIDADAWSFFVLIFLLIGPCCLFLSTSLLFPSVPDEGPLDLETQLQDVGRAFFLAMLGFLVWLFVVEVWLLREPWLALPKRASQLVGAVLFIIGAIRPVPRMATGLGVVFVAMLVIVLATFRARLV